MPRNPDLVVASVAAQLVEATGANRVRVSEQVLAQLVERFDLDAARLRHHDHKIRGSVLVAEWPKRAVAQDPDPLAVVHFGSADPMLAQCEHGRTPVVVRADRSGRPLQRWLGRAEDPASPSIAAAPLVAGDVTTGMLEFVKFGSRKWKRREISTLEAVAALFAGVQARLAAEEKLRYLAEHDDLTGLHNRRALLGHLGERLSAGSPGPVAVLYLDLDRLKAINDCLGHAVGDWFIKVFAQRMRACAGNGMVARMGGDEFVVVAERPMVAADAEALARCLVTMLHERLTVGGHVITRSVSIGVTVGAPGRDLSTDVLRRADQAVLAAKRAGGNQVVVSTDNMSLTSALRYDTELPLPGDIGSEALQLRYLPEVDLWTGAIVAAEDLDRRTWPGDAGRSEAPAQADGGLTAW